MPKAILKYDLPEEKEDFHVATHAWDMHQVIFELNESLRRKIKYSSDSENAEEINTYQKVRDLLWEIINDQGIEDLF